MAMGGNWKHNTLPAACLGPYYYNSDNHARRTLSQYKPQSSTSKATAYVVRKANPDARHFRRARSAPPTNGRIGLLLHGRRARRGGVLHHPSAEGEEHHQVRFELFGNFFSLSIVSIARVPGPTHHECAPYAHKHIIHTCCIVTCIQRKL